VALDLTVQELACDFIHKYFELYKEQQMYVKGKCKTIPLQAWTGPESSRRLRLPDFKTIGT
jgi:hypothetical protein